MSKTFGQLKDGDDVYVIKGNSVDIVKAKCEEESYGEIVFAEIKGTHFFLWENDSSVDDDEIGDIYCDVYEAFREMKKRYNANVITCKQSLDSLHLLEECIPAYRKN
jgi:hypothetical protein